MLTSILIIELILFILIAGTTGIWIYLFLFLKKSFRNSPILPQYITSFDRKPFISIIVPARNEEKFLKNCINSLLNQDYENYEILIIDDNSTDKTLEIAKSFNDTKISVIQSGNKPKEWIGKNWPCFIGYKNSKGEYLLFTDADTIHSKNSLKDSINSLMKENLDVLTIVPNLIYPNFIIKMVLPILSIFMFSRYSPMRVNDPKTKLGYLFGSFFLLSKKIYEKIGTHEIVKEEIVEDGALGRLIKENNFNLKMFRGESMINAYWARDFHTLWNSLKRLIIPIYFTDKKNSILITVGVFLLMIFPFLTLFCLISVYEISDIWINILLVLNIICIFCIFYTNYYQLQTAKTHNTKYFLGTPIGCFIVSISFIWSIISSEKKGVIKWRGQVYNYKK